MIKFAHMCSYFCEFLTIVSLAAQLNAMLAHIS